MKKKIVITLLAFLSVIGYAQEKAHALVEVSDFDGNPISGAQVQFFNTRANTTIEGVSDENGLLEVDLSAGLYNIRLKSVGKAKDYTAIEIPELGPREVYNNVNIVIQYEEEKSFTLSDLHFETGKSNIKPESYDILDELAAYLKLKADLKIEIGGHTDSDGSTDSNLTLSQNRAEAVKKYLIKKGISSNRLTAKGYGESKPIAENETAAGKALNRRTEINILE